MDTNLQSWTHPMRAQVALQELERKLGIQTDSAAAGDEWLDAAYDPGEPPD
jgi:hypothetical protein